MNKEEILNKVLEIINYIKESTDYKNYLKTKELLREDKYLIDLIEDIKKYQKEIIKFPLKKEELENKIQSNLNILNESYIYQEYLHYQEEVNNMLIIFQNKLDKYFYNLINGDL